MKLAIQNGVKMRLIGGNKQLMHVETISFELIKSLFYDIKAGQ